MSTPPEPRWDLLPDDPEGFFGLTGDYDRKALKRAYNVLLRQFKPERHPAEFQRIRGAFELLDGRLRYGSRRLDGPAPTSWEPAAHPPRSRPQRAADPAARAAPRPAYERVLAALDTHPPHKIYDALRRQRQRGPFEYFALAAIADAVGEDDMAYVRWILEGLQAHPREPGLVELLRAALTDPPPTAKLPRVLVAVSKVLRGDAFFYVTEPLWDRLVRDAPFETFRDCLQACEERFTELDGVHGRTVFYLHILRATIWTADPAWIDRAIGFLEDHHDLVPGALEFDFEITLALRDFRRDAPAFLNGHPLRHKMHDALRDYCTLDTAAGDRAFVACQHELIRDPQALCDALPLHDDTAETFVHCWMWIVEEVAERLELIDEPPPFKRVMRDTYQFMRTLDAEDRSSSWTGLVIGQVIGHALAYGLCLAVPALIHTIVLGNPFSWLLSLGCGVVAAVCFHVFLRARTLGPLYERWLLQVVEDRYRDSWRMATLRFLDSTPVAFDMFLHVVDRLVTTRHRELSSSTWLIQKLPGDRALALYTTAVRLIP